MKRKKAFLSLFSRFDWLFFLFCIAAVSAFYGAARCGSVDFVCTNGDYQNYNALRRFLAGQRPYADFANYLGMGPLLLCVPLTALHNNFSGSLFATNFVACACFILFVFLIFYLVTGHKLIAAAAGLLAPKILSSRLLSLLPVLGGYAETYLNLLAKSGNSFRIARLFLPVLYCLLLLFFLWHRQRKGGFVPLRAMLRSGRVCAAVGFFLGMGIVWSNDFGFACIGSAVLVLLILSIADTAQGALPLRRSFSRFLFFLPALAGGGLVSILLVTHFGGGYFRFTQGVSQWQYWYYSLWSDSKIYSLPEFFSRISPHTAVNLLVYLAAMGFALFLLCRKKENDRLILLVFLLTSIFAVQFLYLVACGGDNFQEGSYCAIMLLLCALACKGLLLLAGQIKLLGLARAGAGFLACGVSLLCLVQGISLLRQNAALAESPSYVAELGGVSSNAGPLREMKQIVGDHSLFSTYATALDDMLDNFQPTGCDYIIHALGDRPFDDYLRDFTENHYDFVQTTNYTKWLWEPWANGVSWPFYRELYSNYTLHSDHSVWTLWQYAGEDANLLPGTAEVQLEQLDAQNVRITVTSDQKEPCYADLILSWENDYTDSPVRLLTWQHTVFVYDGSQSTVRHGDGEGYFQPAAAQQRHLPVYLENGSGSIVLSGQPDYCSSLTVTGASCNELIRFVR